MKRVNSVASAFLCLLLLPAATAVAGTVSGVVYHDADLSSRSEYVQAVDPGDIGIQGAGVYLLDGVSVRQDRTDLDGAFDFADVAPGHYLLEVPAHPALVCTSHNRPYRVPAAVREGSLHIVTIGDSIGVYGSDVPYPERLGLHFAELADTTVTNLAVGGSTTRDWVPGGGRFYFDNRLEPVLPDADVLTITLGGNDLDIYAPGGPPYNPAEIIQTFLESPEYLFQIIPNIYLIMQRVREINPNCDIVYVVYPNFGNSSYMYDIIGEPLQPLTAFAMEVVLSVMRRIMAGFHGVVLGDMLGHHSGEWLDPFLVDEVHPNDAGHQAYADAIFRTLGGVVIEDEAQVDERLVGFYAPWVAPPGRPAAGN